MNIFPLKKIMLNFPYISVVFYDFVTCFFFFCCQFLPLISSGVLFDYMILDSKSCLSILFFISLYGLFLICCCFIQRCYVFWFTCKQSFQDMCPGMSLLGQRVSISLSILDNTTFAKMPVPFYIPTGSMYTFFLCISLPSFHNFFQLDMKQFSLWF